MTTSTLSLPRPKARAQATLHDARWPAVLSRDAAADGHFVYAVRTTGVYCRPSCSSRAARPENVTFFDSSAQAQAAGFRACLRCKPDHAVPSHARLVADLCAFMAAADEAPSLQALAERAQLSAFHLQRVFKRFTGLTPKAYARAQRAERMRTALSQAPTVTQALHDAGYNASSRFYAEADAVLGMRPQRYREAGAGMTLRFAVGQCALGAILVAASDAGVCAISLGDDPDALVQELQKRFARASFVGGDPDFEALVAHVIGVVEGSRLGLDLPLDVRGTAFQQRVWQALRAIPAGQTISYADLASRIGAPKAVRAVAQACAANTLAVAIPCHRVVRTDGAISGYRWGVERKRALLLREHCDDVHLHALDAKDAK